MSARFMIVSDVDGTLTGDDDAIAEFAEWLAPQRANIRLVYNSGRFPHQVRETIQKLSLPHPDAIIGGVGTEIELFALGEIIEGWPKLQGNWDSKLIRRLLSEDPRLELQPEMFLSHFKVSYFAHNATREELSRWQFRLQTAGLRTRMVYSSQKDLDFLPDSCDKGTAARFLADMWGFDETQVIACGDTSNDLALFTQGFRGVVVGNALAELKQLDSSDVYHAEGHFAAGVLEGVRHWMAERQAVGRPSLDRSTPAGTVVGDDPAR